MVWGLLILMAVAWVLLVVIGAAVMVRVMTHPPRRTAGAAVAQGLPLDPGDAGLDYGTITFTDATGVEIEAWSVRGGDDDGPIVVMLHGWGDSRIGMLLWYETVAPGAARLVMFDQRGHGDSPHPRYGWSDTERVDVLRLVDKLCERDASARLGSVSKRGAGLGARAQPIVLMGFSMGAATAIDAAVVAGPEKVTAVIADSPFRHVDVVTARMVRAQRLPARPWVWVSMLWLAMRGAHVRRWDTADRAAAMTQPLLILHGTEDRVTPPTDAQSIAEAAPQARVVEFPDAGHLAAACVDTEQYAATVRDFLTSLA
ncbi:MAG: alpha/beta fold hydrolase [Phycisphaera sp.]|nr:alpha/beta fold hydrolase [Phycisphaera sp.]